MIRRWQGPRAAVLVVRSYDMQQGCDRLVGRKQMRWCSSSAIQHRTGGPMRALVSQANGFQHGRTVYGKDRDNRFVTEKLAEDTWQWGSSVSGMSSLPMLDRLPKRLRSAMSTGVDVFSDLFLPRDPTSSVTRDYFPYVKWHFFGSIASSAAGVLSMQSLLYAIGLGAGSIPTAAAVNWVLKDGLGQFGGVMFASLVNNRYDADPKRWRMASAVALDAAVLVEILTPMFPAYFLPMASIANVSKNISWLSASATRAGFHNSFALRENLADITAKSGSQSIAASIAGTGLGILISQLTEASTPHVFGAFMVLSALHLGSLYRGLSCVTLRTLNCQRLHLLIDHFVTCESDSEAKDKVSSVHYVSEHEQFVKSLVKGYQSLYPSSYVKNDALITEIAESPEVLQRVRAFYDKEKYLLNAVSKQDGRVCISVALEDAASSDDAVRAHFHAVTLQRQLENLHQKQPLDEETLWRAIESAYTATQPLVTLFLKQLHSSEWHSQTLLVEEKSARYRWVQE